MKLQTYLDREKLTVTAFAKAANLEVVTAWRVAKGKVIPSPATMRAIATATNGAVTPNDFVMTENAA